MVHIQYSNSTEMMTSYIPVCCKGAGHIEQLLGEVVQPMGDLDIDEQHPQRESGVARDGWGRGCG